MTQHEIEALHERNKRRLIEDRLLITQWCTTLVECYNNTTDDVREKLPELPGTTLEELLPALCVNDPQDIDFEQYKKEAAVLVHIQQEMARLHIAINQEEELKCLSGSTPQS